MRHRRLKIVEALIEKGASADIVNTRGVSLHRVAKETKFPRMINLVSEHLSGPGKGIRNQEPKRGPDATLYQLTKLNPHTNEYEPVSQDDLEEFKRVAPHVYKYFAEREGDEPIASIDALPVSEEYGHRPIYSHWSKAAERILACLMNSKNSVEFLEPVDVAKWGIPDYHQIIK